MNKFWEWMEEKQYAVTLPECYSHTLLIGYLIEYCLDYGHVIGVSNKVMEKRSIEIYYNELVEHVEKLEEEEQNNILSIDTNDSIN